jgi:zinc protease
MSTFSKTETTAETVKAILAEFNRLRNEPPTLKELEDTKSYFIGSFAGERETPQQMAGELWTIELNGLPADFFERLLADVSKTHAPACVRLVQETLDPTKLVIVVVGDARRIQKDLEQIAPLTVVKQEKRPSTESK